MYKLYSKGLSFTGIEWLNSFKILPTIKTFKSYLNITTNLQRTNINSTINLLYPIFWIDNYSKYHKRTRLLSGGGISSNLWSSIGIYLDENINLKREIFNIGLIPENAGQYNNMILDKL